LPLNWIARRTLSMGYSSAVIVNEALQRLDKTRKRRNPSARLSEQFQI
jgi:hypothetical protein